MSSTFALIADEDMGYEWLYVDGKYAISGEPIYTETLLSLIKKHAPVVNVKSYILTESYGERVNYNYSKLPTHLSEFIDGDLEEREV